MTIAEFDKMDVAKKKEVLFNCCGSTGWVKGMLGVFPVNDLIDLLEYAEEQWYDCNPADWLEAFEHHPRIGDIHLIQKNFANTAEYALKEQAGIKDSSEKVLAELAEKNEQYEENFGYLFIIFATGKSAAEMLALLNQRLENDPRDELMIAAAEQDRITKQRLKKLFE